LLALLVVAPLAPAGGSEELTALERHQVARGDLVVKTREVKATRGRKSRYIGRSLRHPRR
jgi:hypothetical protein